VKTVLPAMLALALLPVLACAPKVNDPSDIQAVKQTIEAFAKGMNAGDAEGMVSMMTDKTVYADNHFPVAVGKAAVQSMSAAQNALFKAEFQAPVDEVRVAGDLAVARGTWAIKLTPKAEGVAPIVDSGSWILSASRQADRSWKWDWLVPNSNQPAPGTTAGGAEEQAVIQIERDWVAALVKGDKVALEKILAKEWVANADGEVATRADTLKAIASGVTKFQSAELRDLRVHVFGDVAIAISTVYAEGTFAGKPLPQLQHSTDFFVKREGRWQAISTQNFTVKP
jgi:ketosteroid isomerase-like protein